MGLGSAQFDAPHRSARCLNARQCRARKCKAQQREEEGSFLASLSTDAEMMEEEEEEAEARKRQCVKDILQERAERGEADGMRDGNERVVKEIAQQLMQVLQLVTPEGKAHKPGGSGSAAKTASEEAALHAWLKALGKEGRLVRAWLKPRLDEAVKNLKGRWLTEVKQSTWGLQWEKVGSAKPATGEEIQKAALAEALEGKLELTQGELEQLFLNLTTNARDALPAAPSSRAVLDACVALTSH